MCFQASWKELLALHEKTNNWGFQPGLTQFRLYNHRSRVEALYLRYKWKSNCNIRVRKTLVLISCVVTAFINALNHSIFSSLCLVLVRAPHQAHVRQAKFGLRVCQMVFLGIIPFFPLSFVRSHPREMIKLNQTHYIQYTQWFVQKDIPYVACIAHLIKWYLC